MSHTPGPWEWNMDSISTGMHKGKSIHSTLGNKGIRKAVAYPNYTEHGGGVWETWISVKPEDARLIAAAPILLEALEAVVPPGEDWWCPTCHEALPGSRVTNTEHCDTCGTYIGGTNTPEWVDKARAAIAAARGEGQNGRE
jgi:hypothetical protein